MRTVATAGPRAASWAALAAGSSRWEAAIVGRTNTSGNRTDGAGPSSRRKQPDVRSGESSGVPGLHVSRSVHLTAGFPRGMRGAEGSPCAQISKPPRVRIL
jgi:hypothetical protein